MIHFIGSNWTPIIIFRRDNIWRQIPNIIRTISIQDVGRRLNRAVILDVDPIAAIKANEVCLHYGLGFVEGNTTLAVAENGATKNIHLGVCES